MHTLLWIILFKTSVMWPNQRNWLAEGHMASNKFNIIEKSLYVGGAPTLCSSQLTFIDLKPNEILPTMLQYTQQSSMD